MEQALSGISPRTASVLCYIPGIGWIPAIIVLAAQRFRTNHAVRFHAFQGLYLFVAWLLNQWVVRWIFWPVPHFGLHRMVELVLIATAVFMMVKAAHDEAYSLPIVGELANRSLANE